MKIKRAIKWTALIGVGILVAHFMSTNDRIYKIGDTSVALHYLEEGHACGQAVITLE